MDSFTLAHMEVMELGGMTDDVELASQIVAAQEGDSPEEAHRLFGTLYRRHAAAVLARLSVSASRSQTDDLAQETWMRAWKKLASFKTGSFRAWILTIAVNCRIDSQRRRTPGLLSPDADVADGAARHEREQSDHNDRADVLRNCLSKLNDRHRRVIVGLFYEKTDYETVCRELAITSNAAYKLTHEAKQLLTDCCRRAIR